jgi:hypothetical protein
VLDVAASNIDGFLWEGTCVISTQLKRPILANTAYLHLETPKLQGAFLSKTNTILTGNNVLEAAASNTDCFLSRDILVSST